MCVYGGLYCASVKGVNFHTPGSTDVWVNTRDRPRNVRNAARARTRMPFLLLYVRCIRAYCYHRRDADGNRSAKTDAHAHAPVNSAIEYSPRANTMGM